MRMLAIALLLAVAGCIEANPRIATLQISVTGGTCSATAVGRDLILTAEHCFADGKRLREINGQEAHALEMVRDGADHVLVRVTTRFKHWARVAPGTHQGDRLRWWGNPAGETDVYRVGNVARVRNDEILIDGGAFGGDSGAGLFNDRGELVAVISGGKSWFRPPSFLFQLTVAYPLAFTADQWAEIRE